MHSLVGFVLVLVGIVGVQSVPATSQVDNLNLFEESWNSEFDGFLSVIADILTPAQYESFQQDFLQFILTEATSEINSEELQPKFETLLQQYLGSYLQSRFDKREATAIINQLPTDNLKALLAAAPQLSALINPLNEALTQLSGSLSPTQLQSFQEQALQLILSVTAGNIDVNQFNDRLQALLQQYLNSNERRQVDIDSLIEQVLITDTAGLPNVIINLLGKHDVNVDESY